MMTIDKIRKQYGNKALWVNGVDGTVFVPSHLLTMARECPVAVKLDGITKAIVMNDSQGAVLKNADVVDFFHRLLGRQDVTVTFTADGYMILFTGDTVPEWMIEAVMAGTLISVANLDVDQNVLPAIAGDSKLAQKVLVPFFRDISTLFTGKHSIRFNLIAIPEITYLPYVFADGKLHLVTMPKGWSYLPSRISSRIEHQQIALTAPNGEIGFAQFDRKARALTTPVAHN